MRQNNNKKRIYHWIDVNGNQASGTEEEFDLAFGSLDSLFRKLDKLVSDPSSDMYRYIKNEIRTRIVFAINPFHAGRPRKYDDFQRDAVKALREEGKTVRQISAITGISLGKISDILHDVQN